MAQGGHNWPGGQFHPNGPDQAGVNSGKGGVYSNGIDADSDMLYMPEWSTMNQPAGNFATQHQSNPSGQQFYTPQNYYQTPNAFAQTNRPGEQRSNTASPALAFGNGIYHDPAFQRPGAQQQEQQYPQFNAPELSQHNPQLAGNYADNSWQAQPSHAPQNQYTQPTLSYESPQAMYQQHLQQSVSHSHTPTPPPTQRATTQYAVNNGGQPNSISNMNQAGSPGVQSHSSLQPANPVASQYPFPVNQGQLRNSPFQNTGIPPNAQPPVAYQNQIRFAQPGQAGGQPSLSTSPPQAVAQQPALHINRPASTVQNPVARTESPAAMPNQPIIAPPSVLSYPNGQQIFGLPQAAAPAQQILHTGSTFTLIPSQPPFDPTAQGGFTLLNGEANLFLSDAPIDGREMEMTTEDTYSFSAHFNARDGPLIPNRPKRLPCEIRRDWKWLRKQEKSAENDAKRRAILLEKDHLDREMVQLTGEHVEPSTKVGIKRAATKSENKLATSRKTGSESSDDSSEYESDSDYEESQEDQEARKIKNSGRPSDPVKAVEYDVIHAVWRAPEDAAQPNATATAIQAFGVHIEKLWNKVKDVKKDVKAAKEKKSKKLESLEAELKTQLRLMQAAIEAASKFAEPTVLENMGGNAKLAVILWNALRSAIASKDFNGPLPKAILFLMSHFTTMEKSLVVGVLKVPEYQKKHQKDFDKICNGYLEQIQSKAKGAAGDAEKKGKEAAPSNGVKESTAVLKKAPAFTARDLMSASKKPVATETKKVQPSGTAVLEAKKAASSAVKNNTGSPSKRPRDDDIDSRVAKKVAMDGSSGASSITKPTPSSFAKTTTVVQPRPKSSGSILPGRARPATKPLVKKPEPQQSSGLSTISGLLAEIAKPKSPPRQKDEPARAPETEEEKTRRLRKEARRGLRVMWRPDHELEQIRIFQHDAAEDEGRASNMVRDARDNRSEGQALKRARVNPSEEQDGEAEKEDDDDDTEDSKPKEVTLREWRDPVAIDFGHVDLTNPGQREKSFVTRGGLLTFHTEEQKYMEKYEQTQLIAIYTSLSDIPDTPKSPLRKEAEKLPVLPTISQLPADTPNLQEIHVRWTEIAQFGADEATQRMIQRLRNTSSPERAAKFDRLLLDLQNASMSSQDRNQPYAFAPSSSQAAQKQKPSSATPNLPILSQEQRDAEVLRLLNSEKVQKWTEKNSNDLNNPKTQRRVDYGDAKVQADVDAFEALASAFAGNPYPATEPPQHLISNPAYVKEWQMGYDKDLANKATQDATERAKKLAEEFSRNSAAAGLQPASQPIAPQAAQDPNAAWAAYFAQMNHNQAQPQSVQSQQLTYDQYAAILQQTQALQAQHAGPSAHAQLAQHSLQQQPQQPDPNSQIGALLAALGGQAAQPQAAAPPAAAPIQQDPNAANAAAWAAYYASLGQAQAQPPVPHHQPQAQQQSYRHRDRDQDKNNRSNHASDAMLDYGPSEAELRDKNHRGRKENKDAFRGKDYDRKGINRSLIGTKPCTFWAQGKCAKGDQCTFRHDPNDLVD